VPASYAESKFIRAEHGRYESKVTEQGVPQERQSGGQRGTQASQ
jgi:hypothetical protein